MNEFLPYARQRVGNDDIAAVVDVLRGDWLTTGPTIEAFERALGAEVNAPNTLVCSSGTAALHLAALAIGLRPGDRVVVPALTFVATANAARLVGAEVVFADVDPDTGLMEAEHLDAALARTGDHPACAVFPVHLNGQSPDMPTLAKIAREHGLMVVEDAAHALGTSYLDGNGGLAKVGECRHSDLTAFSFHPVKTVAMGEGGALTGGDSALIDHARRLRSHGIERDASAFKSADLGFDERGAANPWYYEMLEVGFNYRASDIHCALGLSQLAKLAQFTRERARLVARYDALLAPIAPLVRPIARALTSRPAWHLYVLRVDFAAAGSSRGAVMRALRERGIGTQVHYLPLHLQPYYRRRYGDLSLPGAEAYYADVLSLPLHTQMDETDVDRVVAALSEVLGK